MGPTNFLHGSIASVNDRGFFVYLVMKLLSVIVIIFLISCSQKKSVQISDDCKKQMLFYSEKAVEYYKQQKYDSARYCIHMAEKIESDCKRN